MPRVIDFPSSTIAPSVHTSAAPTAARGSMTPRLVRKDHHNVTMTSRNAIGVNCRRSWRISSAAACVTCPEPVK